MAHFRPSRSCHTGCVGSPPWPDRGRSTGAASAAPPSRSGRGGARLRGVGLARRGAGRARGGAGRGGRPAAAVPAARSPRSTPRRGRPPPPTSASSTGCCRAGSCPGRSRVLGGEPGIGKSTLLLQALAGLAKAGHRCLYVTAEESAQQVRLRAERLGALPPNLWLVSDTALPHVLGHIESVAPDVVAVDSIQTVFEPVAVLGARARSPRCASAPTASCGSSKERAMSSVLVGHVTKDGALAGPRVLEHLVDTVLSFEGERHHALRLLRAVKHRFGSTDELGLFEMTDGGLESVPDPSALFLADRRPGTPGSVVAPVLDGHRPLLVEVQALVAPFEPSPRPAARRRASTAGGSRSCSPCCSSTSTMPFAELRRPHGGGRRREDGRAGRRPRAGARPRVGALRARRCPTTSSRAARSASAASCARCTRPLGGSPRRPGSGSAARSCPPARRSHLPGIDVLRVATLARGRRRVHRRAAQPPRLLSRRLAPAVDRGAPGSIGRWPPAAAPSS